MATHLPIFQPRSSLQTDGSRATVHPADVRGRFTRLRYVVFVVLIGIYAALPWIHIGNFPAVMLDIEHRRFYLFGNTFNAQDFWLVFFLLTAAGFALIVLTTVLGRVWCGYACPQTVFLEGVYRRVQRLVEGSREKRMRRDAGPWTLDRIARKAVAHTAYVLISLVLAHVFLSYFVSIPAVFAMVRRSPGEHPEAFAWVMGIAGALYFNFSWFREQLCMIICPYGRLQSVMTDRDTIVVGYDTRRGEPRTHGKEKKEGAGDCVDCGRCVVVCPTGIDIRNGLQLDCVGCSACVDACDDVMDKLGRARGLVRYDSLNGLEGQPKRMLRPRLYFYAFLGALGLLVVGLVIGRYHHFDARLLRLPGSPYVIDGATLRNSYEIHLVNKEPDTVTFSIDPMPARGLTFVIPMRTVRLESLGERRIPVFVSTPVETAHRETVEIVVRAGGGGETQHVEAPFIAP